MKKEEIEIIRERLEGLEEKYSPIPFDESRPWIAEKRGWILALRWVLDDVREIVVKRRLEEDQWSGMT